MNRLKYRLFRNLLDPNQHCDFVLSGNKEFSNYFSVSSFTVGAECVRIRCKILIPVSLQESKK